MNAVEFKPSPDQRQAMDAIHAFVEARQPLLTLGGYAGVGKTVVVSQFAKELRDKKRKRLRIAFCAFTGKASSVLKRKLVAAEAIDDDEDRDYCGTIHGLIYTAEKRPDGTIRWKRREHLPFDFIINDEASMTDEKLFRDLQSYGLPILAVGDHGQLPPVSGSLNLMADPDLKLEKIHRQAEDNPIIKLSMMARTDGFIPFGSYGTHVHKIAGSWGNGALDKVQDLDSVMFLANFNKTRTGLNAVIRKRLGITSEEPIVGDRVICLRNMREAGIFNGMQGRVLTIEPFNVTWWRAEVQMDDGGPKFSGLLLRSQFGAEKTIQDPPLPPVKPNSLLDFGGEKVRYPWGLFDFGYALTVHKSQGSEAPRVMVFEERSSYMTDDNWRRWVYTAVTRSSDRLLIVGQK